jgi:hypothetical protein
MNVDRDIRYFSQLPGFLSGLDAQDEVICCIILEE